MAFQLTITDSTTQVPAAYHQVAYLNVNFIAGTLQIGVNTYVSQAAAAAGAQPVRRQNFSTTNIPATLLNAINNQIAGHPEFSGATVVAESATAG